MHTFVSIFRAQVAEERRLGLTPALHMDAKDERVQCQLEINFIDCVVTPLWEHCAHCFPALQPCMERVRANRAAYAALAQCSNEEVAQVSKSGGITCKIACFMHVARLAASCCSCQMQQRRGCTAYRHVAHLAKSYWHVVHVVRIMHVVNHACSQQHQHQAADAALANCSTDERAHVSILKYHAIM